MRIRIRPSRRQSSRIVLNMASMIDATFLLLGYFLFTTSAIKPEDRLTPNLKTQTAAGVDSSADFQPQIVEVLAIDGVPSFRLGERAFTSRGELVAALRNLSIEQGLFVHVHGDVAVGFAAAALQAGRDVGFDQVTYVAVD
jgi:biopolymer transport protein ExbD